MNPMQLSNHLFMGFYLEGIADETRRTARFSRFIKVGAKDKITLLTFLSKIEQYYLDTMKAIYDKDGAWALRLSDSKLNLNHELDVLEKNNTEYNFMNMVSRLRRMLSYIHSLGRIVYQGITIQE
ncbi:MAG: hypothetical protein AABX04_05660 [Nanoarchaeota archaeon]